MKKLSVRVLLMSFLVVLALSAAAQAQATRTWVSGVGDDANPCSRTAPCKTFAGAISKTAPAGEINVLDPGGFGAVTITKSITISSEGFEAGVLVSGTNGIVVSAGPTDVVVLRGLDIEGLGTGLAGIKVLSAGVVHVEKCTINNFTAKGIDFQPSSVTPGSNSLLFVSNTIIRNNRGASSGGIFVKTGTNVASKALISGSQLLNNTFGVSVDGTVGSTIARMSNNDIIGSTTNALLNNAGNLTSFGNNRILDLGSVPPGVNPPASIGQQ
ncbi:MAG TPA: hypothetical protein VIA62_16595 [Thermoanaerobaculia bacterium]|jgi:hypothetical protein|nr:hypothetical protein [Thermoanaerobaculia bacterium]